MKTFVIVFIIVFGMLLWNSLDSGSHYSWVKYPIGIFLIIAIVTAPIDDLAIDDNHFYHFRTSLLPMLSKVKKYEIGKIKNIRSGGMLTQTMDALEFFTFRGGRRNTIEITFTDDSYKSLDVVIYREELTKILTTVKEMIKRGE